MMFYVIIALLAISLTVSYANGEAGPFVEIHTGKIQGTILKSRDGRKYSAFMGVPYANKPERFEISEPVSPWSGTLDTSKFGSKCLQFDMTVQQIVGDEDCLFVNVFSPNVNGDLPVLVFIHGGGFQFGNSDENGADYFMDEDVVLVTLNYRLNSLGFLSMGDDVLPGNLGLKDQNLALKWVRDNVKFFGGNPKKVTLFGESAGGASVSYHILSPLSQGLFRYAICVSGTALNQWAFIENPSQSAKALGEKLNCPADTSQGLKNCLKQKSAIEIVQQVVVKNPAENIIKFGPTAEPVSSTAFLTTRPQRLYEQGKFARIPVVFTVNEDEGLLIHSALIMKDESLRKMVDENWMDMAPSLFLYDDPKHSKETKDQISKALRKHYFKEKAVSQETFQNLTDVFSDSHFIHGARKAALLHAKHAPAYTAVLAYIGTWSQIFNIGYTKVLGMTHADDLQYYFSYEKYPTFPPKSETLMASKLFVKTFVNFATNGDPNLESLKAWEPLTQKEIETGTINWLYAKMPLPRKSTEPLNKRMQLWDRISKKLATAAKGKDEL